MRSIQSTREQLLEIAVQEFARNGFERTSVRSIAKAANTSPALLIHYFSTKDQLVSEAISLTLGEWIGVEKAALIQNPETRISDWVSLVRSGEVKLQFFRQVLLANNEYTKRLFEFALIETKQMLETGIAAGVIKPLQDLDTASALLTSQALAHLVFLPHLESALGGAISEQTVASKLMLTQQELMPLTQQPTTQKETK